MGAGVSRRRVKKTRKAGVMAGARKARGVRAPRPIQPSKVPEILKIQKRHNMEITATEARKILRQEQEPSERHVRRVRHPRLTKDQEYDMAEIESLADNVGIEDLICAMRPHSKKPAMCASREPLDRYVELALESLARHVNKSNRKPRVKASGGVRAAARVRGDSVAQEKARAKFAKRVKKVNKLMREGMTRKQAWKSVLHGGVSAGEGVVVY